MTIEPGQVLILNMQVNNSGTILNKHPYLVMYTNNEYIEVAQMDSLEGKEFKAAKKSNKIILNENPIETVIDKDSYIQLDNLLRIEYFDEIAKMRPRNDKLSKDKFDEALQAYKDYQLKYSIDENKQVYMFKNEIIKINAKLK